jgi:hypothetical protein
MNVDHEAVNLAREQAANRHERVRVIATILASFDDVIFRTAPSRVRAIYLNAAGAAMDAAATERKGAL